jgi:hypothetical protein
MTMTYVRISIFALSVSLSACGATQLKGRATTIQTIEAVTNADKVGPGGSEATVTSRVFALDLEDCGQYIADRSERWAAANSLPNIQHDVEPGRAQLLYDGGDAMPGYFEVLYRLGNSSAKVSFFFYAADGEVLEPVREYKPAVAFAEELKKAVDCDE